MNIKIAIVDDRVEDRDRLGKSLQEYFDALMNDKVEIETFPSAEEFLSSFRLDKYQMAFLDIVMDEMNGIQLAKKLRETDPHILIVFQTTSREYAFDAFPVHPFDYLMKPINQRDLEGVMAEALRVIQAGDPEIKVSSTKGTFTVPLRSIYAVTSQGHNVEFKLANNQKLISTETFKSIEAKLSADSRFLLINRGIIVNMDQVLQPADGNMKMKDESLYPIRINGRTAVLSTFSQYMISKVEKRGV